MIRLARLPVLPFSYSDQCSVIKAYVDELQALSKSQREEIVERNNEIDEGMFTAPWIRVSEKIPERQPVPAFLNFAPLLNAF